MSWSNGVLELLEYWVPKNITPSLQYAIPQGVSACLT